MASAQVLSNSSRKQEHLEAGKRRLEEFRKKKAAAKKSVSTTGQPPATESPTNEKQVSDNGEAPSVKSPGTSYGTTDTVAGTSGILNHADTTHGFVHDSGSQSVTLANNDSHSNNFGSPDLLQMLPKEVGNTNNASEIVNQSGSLYTESRDDKVGTSETDIGERRNALAVPSGSASTLQYGSNGNFRSSISGGDEDIGFSVNLSNLDVSTNDFAAKLHPDRHTNNLFYHEPDSINSSTDSQPSTSELAHNQQGALEFKNCVTSGLEERQPNYAVGNFRTFGSQQASDPLSGGFKSSISSSSNGPLSSALAETYARRSRPSFLDSLNIGRDSPASGRSFSVKEDPTVSKLSNSEFAVPAVIADTSTSSAPVEPLLASASSSTRCDIFGNAYRGQNLFENSLEDFKSQRQNEDFAALEQHIEDLTQEKFSMQRALEASKTLAESLAAENSSLTESYNQQASNVSHLKAEMEKLQEEIKARLVELEAIKAEYTNAQLECNAADERAKLLASEVISLEEKALRLRSNELKLERELEKSGAEIASYEKKLSSLERERRDLQQTIEALQEEKKLLQSKLRRPSTSAIQADLYNGHPKKDASTCTKDLVYDASGGSSEHISSIMEFGDDSNDVMLLLQNSSAVFDNVALSVPPDQMQMIQNINSLISEIMSEKEELMQALLNEVSTSTKLKDLNKELSRKLEIQTQRLELLTSQSMASENGPARQPSGSRIIRDSVTYADEGDEVVERVLGWIMKLFPGGPSKRRTSRL